MHLFQNIHSAFSARAAHVVRASVIPAEAGIHVAFPYDTAGVGFPGTCRLRAFATSCHDADSAWIPASAGMTKESKGMTGARAGMARSGHQGEEKRM